MGEADGDGLVVLHALVVGAHGAVDEGEDQALQRVHGVVHEDGLERAVPLLLAHGDLLQVGLLARQGGDAEHQVQLSQLVVVLHLVGIGHELFVDAQEVGLVHYGEQRRPLLEVDVDAPVREQPGRDPHGLRRLFGKQWIAALDVQERLRVEIRARLAILLDLALERLCGGDEC